MQIPVMIEWVSGNGFRARGGEPFAFTAEGATRDEALENLRELIESKLTAAVEITYLDIPVPDNPLRSCVGTLDPNDSMVQEWLDIMKENRRKTDEDPDYL